MHLNPASPLTKTSEYRFWLITESQTSQYRPPFYSGKCRCKQGGQTHSIRFIIKVKFSRQSPGG